MLVIVWAILCAVVQGFRETLPSSDDDVSMGAFVSGMTWAFVLHWAILIAVTYGYCSARGGC